MSEVVESALCWLLIILWLGLAVLIVWIIFFFLAIIFRIDENAEAYDVEVTFDGVDNADHYAIVIGNTQTIVAAGGNPYASTTVTVYAIGGGRLSAPSNTLILPPLVEDCERMDLDNNGALTASDALVLLHFLDTGVCD